MLHGVRNDTSLMEKSTVYTCWLIMQSVLIEYRTERVYVERL